MRILHLIPTLVGGGAERQLTYLANALQIAGADVHVGFVHEGPNLPRLHAAGIPVHRVSASNNHSPLIATRLWSLMRWIRPDVVQTWLLQMDVFGGMSALARRLPWVLAERSSAPMYVPDWKNTLRRELARHSAAVVANSKAGLDYWSGLGRGRRDRVIRNIVPSNEIASAAGTSAAGMASEPTILVAGRYSEEKNLLVVLQALSMALERLPSARALFFGSGPAEPAIRGFHASLHPAVRSRVHIGGYCDDLWGQMGRARVYVSLSRFEGNPNTVLEAIACRCPVIVSDIPAHTEILNDEMALLVSPNSPQQLASAIIQTFSDNAAAQRRVQQAFAALQRCSALEIASEYLALYRDLTGRN